MGRSWEAIVVICCCYIDRIYSIGFYDMDWIVKQLVAKNLIAAQSTTRMHVLAIHIWY